MQLNCYLFIIIGKTFSKAQFFYIFIKVRFNMFSGSDGLAV